MASKDVQGETQEQDENVQDKVEEEKPEAKSGDNQEEEEEEEDDETDASESESESEGDSSSDEDSDDEEDDDGSSPIEAVSNFFSSTAKTLYGKLSEPAWILATTFFVVLLPLAIELDKEQQIQEQALKQEQRSS